MSFSVLEINKATLRNNIQIIKNKIGTAMICLPVKANAYGHGIELIVENTYDLVDYFAVACVSEANRVLTISTQNPILIFGAIEYTNIDSIIDNGYIVSLQCISDISKLEDHAQRRAKKINVHININTGMNRMGITLDEYQAIIKSVYDSEFLELLGVYSHFACADNKDHPANKKQISMFEKVKDIAKSLDDKIICHLANSYGLLGQSGVCYDMVRPGILIYGYLPYFYVEKDIREINPVARLISQVVKIHTLKDGDGVGYSLVYRGFEGEKLATIPVGYGDGFFRSLGDKGCVSINNKIYRIVGRISMDALAVSLEENSDNVMVGQEVEIISNISKHRNSVFAIAELTNTIEYDVVTNLSDRVIRKVV